MSKAEKTETYVVIGRGYWGAGDSLAEAKRNLAKVGGRLSDGYVLLTFDAESEFQGVDGFNYSYTGNPPAEQVVKPRKRRS